MVDLWHYLHAFLSSPATTALVAILAALGAFLIYFMRRRDAKVDAANIILLEIKNAESNLEQARKSYEEARAKNPNAVSFPEKLRLMNTESWTRFKYLFIRDLTPEQWDIVGNFYENCKNFDEAVEHKDSSFRANEHEIRVNIHQVSAQYSKNLADRLKPNPDNSHQIEKENQGLIEEYKFRKEAAVDAIIRKLLEMYTPDKPFNDAAYYYSLLPTSLMNTPTGQRLKEIADRRLVKLGRRKQ